MNDIVNSNFQIGSIVLWNQGDNSCFAIVIGRSLLWELARGYHCDIEHPVFICYFMENGSYGHTAVEESRLRKVSSVFTDLETIDRDLSISFGYFEKAVEKPREYINGFIGSLGVIISYIFDQEFDPPYRFFKNEAMKKISFHLFKNKPEQISKRAP